MPIQAVNRVALITGGARRVGRAVLERLAGAGFDIAFTYLGSEAEAKEVAAGLEKMGRRCVTIRADLTEPQVASELVANTIIAEFERLDVLFNNASIYEATPLDQLDLETRTADVGDSCRIAADAVPAARAIVAGSRGGTSLTWSICWPSGRGRNIWLMRQARRAVESDARAGAGTGAGSDRERHRAGRGGVARRIIRKRKRTNTSSACPWAAAGTPGDVAETVHFLCTAGSYITGQIIRLDGGRSMTWNPSVGAYEFRAAAIPTRPGSGA